MFPSFYLSAECGLLVARIILAIVLIAHGWPKLKDLRGTAAWMESNGFKPGFLFAPFAAVLEFFGGLALILGLFTQVVAILLILQFVIIILWKLVTRHNFKFDLEIDLLVLGLAVVLLTGGAGTWALDTLFIF